MYTWELYTIVPDNVPRVSKNKYITNKQRENVKHSLKLKWSLKKLLRKLNMFYGIFSISCKENWFKDVQLSKRIVSRIRKKRVL